MWEKQNVGVRVDVNAVVGDNDGKEYHINDGKGDETLKINKDF